MEITYIDPDDTTTLRLAFDLMQRAIQHDWPHSMPMDFRFYQASYQRGKPGSEHRYYLAREQGRPVGALTLGLNHKANLKSAFLDVFVDPDERRKGHGTAMLEFLYSEGRKAGRHTFYADTHTELDPDRKAEAPGFSFAQKHGFDIGLEVVNRIFEVTDLSADRERELTERAERSAAGDYELRSFIGHPPVDLKQAVAALTSTTMDEVPLGDLELESQKDSVADREHITETRLQSGVRPMYTVACHRETGELAALTLLFVYDRLPDVYQGLTIVTPRHRGHKLGLWVKMANLRLLRREAEYAQRIWTDNADVNAQMNAINAAMGFKPVDMVLEFQKKTE
ncbi:GNAT family N-acetyltransferase [Haloglycomyces albus]|uniref:GNAT family N-acetyltransferase n=1 Tax=Haloglycomyces albus TaxID=526067 RepID=UPI00046D6033|nr:GNAT family N-acetyltransferase [Haloglycomyces albus]